MDSFADMLYNVHFPHFSSSCDWHQPFHTQDSVNPCPEVFVFAIFFQSFIQAHPLFCCRIQVLVFLVIYLNRSQLSLCCHVCMTTIVWLRFRERLSVVEIAVCFLWFKAAEIWIQTVRKSWSICSCMYVTAPSSGSVINHHMKNLKKTPERITHKFTNLILIHLKRKFI